MGRISFITLLLVCAFSTGCGLPERTDNAAAGSEPEGVISTADERTTSESGFRQGKLSAEDVVRLAGALEADPGELGADGVAAILDELAVIAPDDAIRVRDSWRDAVFTSAVGLESNELHSAASAKQALHEFDIALQRELIARYGSRATVFNVTAAQLDEIDESHALDDALRTIQFVDAPVDLDVRECLESECSPGVLKGSCTYTSAWPNSMTATWGNFDRWASSCNRRVNEVGEWPCDFEVVSPLRNSVRIHGSSVAMAAAYAAFGNLIARDSGRRALAGYLRVAALAIPACWYLTDYTGFSD